MSRVERQKNIFFYISELRDKMRLVRGGGALLYLCAIYSALPLLPPLPIFPLLSLCSPGGYNLRKTNTVISASFAFTSTKYFNSSFFLSTRCWSAMGVETGGGGGLGLGVYVKPAVLRAWSDSLL